MEHRSQSPAPLLLRFLPRLPKGKALDFASGYGRNAFFLASNGYAVEGFDRNDAAIAFCNEKARKEGHSFTAHFTDLEKEVPSKEETYDVATCFYYLDRKIISKLKQSLKIGGMIVYETFLIDQHRQYGKPSRTEFCWEYNELLHHFSDFRILFYHEGMIPPEDENTPSENGTWVAQLIAERLI